MAVTMKIAILYDVMLCSLIEFLPKFENVLPISLGVQPSKMSLILPEHCFTSQKTIIMKIFCITFQGLMARVYETFIVLCLLAVVLLGMTYVMSALIDKEQSNIYRLLSKLTNVFNVVMILLCF